MFTRAFFLIIFVALTGCTKWHDPDCDDVPTGPSGPAVTITLSPDSSQIYQGESIQLNAIVTGSADKDVIWSSLNPSVLQVSSTGGVTGAGLGKGRISGVSRADPTKKDTVVVVVVNRPQLRGITISPTQLEIRVGQKFTPAVEVTADPGISTGYRCFTTNASVATVNPTTCEITAWSVNPAGVNSPIQIVAETEAVHPTLGKLQAGMFVTVRP
jgi:uncharacterized protein YjdB